MYRFANQSAAVAGETCLLPLAIAGGDPSHEALLRKHAAARGRFAGASRIGAAARRNQSGRRRGIVGEVPGKWIPNQAGHGFWSGQRTCGDDKVFAVGTNAKKVVSRAFGGIFSGGWANKMEIPVNRCSTDRLEVCHEERDSSAFLLGNLHLLSGNGAGQYKAGRGRIKKAWQRGFETARISE